MKHVGPFSARLRSVGNPDLSQYSPVSDPETFEASTLRELRAKIQEYQDRWDLGAGNWVAPVVRDSRGNVVGHFSYNLRLWAGRSQDWTPETKMVEV